MPHLGSAFWVQRLGFRGTCLGFEVLGSRSRVQGLGFRVKGRVSGFGFRVEGLGFWV